MSDWNPRANELFLEALDLPEPERPAFIATVCGDDASLEHALQTLLRAHAGADGFLAAPHPDAIPTGSYADHAATRTTGDSIRSIAPAVGQVGTVIAGRYKLLQQIGEGGMGTVWMADQTEPVKRRVAVKLIRAERGTSATILARFEAERQAIALMDHPHIAKLLDAGETPPTHAGGSPSPYFIMELVKGVPLTEYCDAHKLTIADRLHLFQLICGAVQHAHQKGIIHRDLKPTNILVESHDGKAVPKVIDFGLAKATSGMQLTDNTLFTGFGTVMGTPLYMAPEQATFNAVDVDTRADIYTLGVILYELLTGTTPLTRETIKRAALDEMLKLIREQDAPTPSSRLSSAENKPSVAANRQTEPLKLGRYVKGELDWIVLKALSKERDRRYETANGFAADIGRFLNHEAVLAGPVTARYRMRKFVRRNRPQVIAGSLVLLALLLGVVGTTLGLIEAKKQQGIAVAAQRAEAERAEGERLARLDAQANEKLAVAAAENERIATALTAARLEQIGTINNTVFDIFAELDIKKVRESNVPVESVLARKLVAAGRKLDAKAIHDPVVLAGLQTRLGQTLSSLGERVAAVEMLAAAAETRRASLGPDHPDTLRSMSNLASGYLVAGWPDKGVPLLEETLALQKVKLGPDHADILFTEQLLGTGYLVNGRSDKGVPLMEETLARKKVNPGPDHPDTLAFASKMWMAYAVTGQLHKAVPLMEETLAVQKVKLGPDHLDTLGTSSDLGSVYYLTGQPDKAITILEQTVARQKAKLGPDHPHTRMSMINLAKCYPDVAMQEFAAGRPLAGLQRLAAFSAEQPRECALFLKVAALQAWFGQDAGLAATRRRLLAPPRGPTTPSSQEMSPKRAASSRRPSPPSGTRRWSWVARR